MATAALPPAPLVGTIKNAATAFLRWAHEHSLLAPDAFFPGADIEAPAFDVDPGPVAVSVLRQKQIRFVGVNPSADQINVYLVRAAPSSRASKVLPKTCNGYQLRFHQGNPEPISPASVAEATNTCTVRMINGSAFYTCGSSISVGNARSAGTLGCLLQDQAGILFGLSNNHVTACCNYAPVGLPILAPGVTDVSPTNPPPFTIGFHRQQLPMLMGDPSSVDATQNRDAAIFAIADPNAVSSMQQGYFDTPASVLDLAPGMGVEKVGRTSERTRGQVQAELIGASPIMYSASHYSFSGAVYFEPLFLVHGIGDRFSEAGDSGSLVTHLDANGVRHAVGIVVGGATDNSAPGGKLSLILPIRPILNQFGLSLKSNHNVT
jgi:hypothetical protein